MTRHPLTSSSLRIHLDFKDQEELSRLVSIARSRELNPHRLESYWYPVYGTLFKPLTTGIYVATLTQEFTVSRVFRQETEETIYHPKPSKRRPGDPKVVETRWDPEAGKSVLVEVEPPPSRSEEPTPRVTDVKELRRWRIPDFALLVTRRPKEIVRVTEKIRFPGGQNPATLSIVGPTLSATEVIVPVIIEVKAPPQGRTIEIYRALMTASKQLLEQATFLFLDFPWLKEVIAIAGVGLYWWWFRIPRPSPTHLAQGSGDEYEQQSSPSSDTTDSPSDHQSSAPSHPTNILKLPTLPDVPFVIGTTRSDEAVLEVKSLVDKLVHRGLRTRERSVSDGKAKVFYDLLGACNPAADANVSPMDDASGHQSPRSGPSEGIEMAETVPKPSRRAQRSPMGSP